MRKSITISALPSIACARQWKSNWIRFWRYCLAHTDCGRRYNDDEPCSSQSPSTAFYTQTQLRQRDFCTEKVPVLMWWLFTVDSRFEYFCQDPVVPRIDPPLIIIRTVQIILTVTSRQVITCVITRGTVTTVMRGINNTVMFHSQ